MSNMNEGDPLNELVGEGKKYKTVEDLARSRLEADQHIGKLEVENAALRQAVLTEVDPAEMLRKVQAAKGSGNAVPNQSNQSPVAPLSEERVLELLSAREENQKRQQNKAVYDNALAKAFGEKTAEVLANRLGELGMDKDSLEALAVKNPTAALRILGVNSGGSAGSGSLTGSVTTEAYLSEKLNGEVKNFAYFNKLRQDLKERFYEPEVQREMWQARQKLGEKFWIS
jgi:hypothetical protein